MAEIKRRNTSQNITVDLLFFRAVRQPEAQVVTGLLVLTCHSRTSKRVANNINNRLDPFSFQCATPVSQHTQMRALALEQGEVECSCD